MSSALIYLAIVVVWAGVLVPMWLRRDAMAEYAGRRRLLARLRHPGGEETSQEDGSDTTGQDAEASGQEVAAAIDGDDATVSASPADEHAESAEPSEPARPAPSRRPGRARVIMRRRRRTTVLTLLLAGTGAAVAAGLLPAWTTLAPLVLLAGHLVLLREAAKADAEQRARAAARQAAMRQARRRARPATPTAQVIEIKRRANELYDQYADAKRRAVGE